MQPQGRPARAASVVMCKRPIHKRGKRGQFHGATFISQPAVPMPSRGASDRSHRAGRGRRPPRTPPRASRPSDGRAQPAPRSGGRAATKRLVTVWRRSSTSCEVV
eukprot:scaffold56054_cov61-Phaeocystis_antarctica.AAC.4